MIEHRLHEDLVVIASVVGKRVNHPLDRLCQCRVADDTEYGIVLPGLGARGAVLTHDHAEAVLRLLWTNQRALLSAYIGEAFTGVKPQATRNRS